MEFSLEIVIWFVISLVLGITIFSVVTNVDYKGFYNSIKDSFLGDEDNKKIEKVNSEELFFESLDIWKSCGFGEIEKSKVFLYNGKDRNNNDKNFNEVYFSDMVQNLNLCSVISTDSDTCGKYTKQFSLDSINGELVVKISCDPNNKVLVFNGHNGISAPPQLKSAVTGAGLGPSVDDNSVVSAAFLGSSPKQNVDYGVEVNLAGGLLSSDESTCNQGYSPILCELELGNEVYSNFEVFSSENQFLYCTNEFNTGYSLNLINFDFSGKLNSICIDDNYYYEGSHVSVPENSQEESNCQSGYKAVACEYKFDNTLFNVFSSSFEFSTEYFENSEFEVYCQRSGEEDYTLVNNFVDSITVRSICVEENQVQFASPESISSDSNGNYVYEEGGVISECPQDYSAVACEWKLSSENTWKTNIEKTSFSPIPGQNSLATCVRKSDSSFAFKMENMQTNLGIDFRSICVKSDIIG